MAAMVSIPLRAVRYTFRTTADGHATTIAVMEAPNWFGEISIFDGMPRTHDGHAQGPTTLLFHAKTDFKRLLARYPVIYERFARMLALRLRATFDLVRRKRQWHPCRNGWHGVCWNWRSSNPRP